MSNKGKFKMFGFKIISEREFNSVEELLAQHQKDINNLEVDLSISLKDVENKNEEISLKDEEIRLLQERNDILEAEIKAIKETLGRTQSDNFVKLSFSDDLETITPVVSVTDEVIEMMIDRGMMAPTDNPEERRRSGQLNMMVNAEDGLSQILSSFEEKVED